LLPIAAAAAAAADDDDDDNDDDGDAVKAQSCDLQYCKQLIGRIDELRRRLGLG